MGCTMSVCVPFLFPTLSSNALTIKLAGYTTYRSLCRGGVSAGCAPLFKRMVCILAKLDIFLLYFTQWTVVYVCWFWCRSWFCRPSH